MNRKGESAVSMQSKTFKLVVVMFVAAYVIVWACISIKSNAMYVPPAELNSSLVVSVMLQVLNGAIGKIAYKKEGGA